MCEYRGAIKPQASYPCTSILPVIQGIPHLVFSDCRKFTTTRPSIRPHRIHRRKHIFITTLRENNGLIWNGSGASYVVVMHSGPPARINEIDDTDAARHADFVCLCVSVCAFEYLLWERNMKARLPRSACVDADTQAQHGW